MKTCKGCSTPLKGAPHYIASRTFCSSKCQRDHEWRTQSVPLIESGGTIGHKSLKRYLIERGDVCAECGSEPEWNGKPLTLQLDHLDGDSDNNTLSNVRMVCPNCHSQTDNWGFKRGSHTKTKQAKRNIYRRKK
jgi:RNA polymerase subunit RPABC4/transcription elongation factor Spt4